MELSGKIKWIDETKTYGSNGFRKREVVITTEEQYPQHILIEFIQDKCDLLNTYQVGQDVKIGINLRGREWVNPEGQTNTLILFKVGKLKQQRAPYLRCHLCLPASAFEPAEGEPKEVDDDLPF